MKRFILNSIIALFCLLLAMPSNLYSTIELIDYSTLTHTLLLKEFRAGNHDPSGFNKYFFQVTFLGLLNNKDERNLEPDNRKHLLTPAGVFANIEIPSLSVFKANKDSPIQLDFEVTGDAIRKLIAEMMTKFSVKEEQVAVQVKIALFMKTSKYFFLTEDKKLVEISYFPVPYDVKKDELRMNKDLTLKDDQGSRAIFSITFKNPSKAAAAATSAVN